MAGQTQLVNEQRDSEISSNDVAVAKELQQTFFDIKRELGSVIFGQADVVEKLMICIFARGHALLMGVPGLAKTLMVQKLAEIMDLSFNRIQFTPDLMPSDITGTEILQDSEDLGRRVLEFVYGPVFANIVLADEINRTPPKTQAALLEAMQEHKVTVSGRTYTLAQPFFVLATQNPIEQEGTYPLPEAQLDRFMFFIKVDYPSAAEELIIARKTTGNRVQQMSKKLSGTQILQFQELVRRIPVPDHIYDYVVRLVRMSRPQPDSPDWIRNWITWGAGPRAVQYLILGAKARAALYGSYMVRMSDIQAVAAEVLTHRVLLSFHAESEGISSTDVVQRMLAETEAGE